MSPGSGLLWSNRYPWSFPRIWDIDVKLKVTKIATGETEKGEVVDSTLRLV